MLQCSFDLLRQGNQEEEVGGIQIILTGLVHYPEQPFFLGNLIRDDLIDLPNDKIVTALIL